MALNSSARDRLSTLGTAAQQMQNELVECKGSAIFLPLHIPLRNNAIPFYGYHLFV
jgi:hypothetical protein